MPHSTPHSSVIECFCHPPLPTPRATRSVPCTRTLHSIASYMYACKEHAGHVTLDKRATPCPCHLSDHDPSGRLYWRPARLRSMVVPCSAPPLYPSSQRRHRTSPVASSRDNTTVGMNPHRAAADVCDRRATRRSLPLSAAREAVKWHVVLL